jgi:hypothetical protein
MAKFNRNIVTQADVANFTAPHESQMPLAFAVSPPAGVSPSVAAAATAVGAAAEGAGGVQIPTEDDYLTKLLKYVPLEVLGAYLFMQGVARWTLDRNSDSDDSL